MTPRFQHDCSRCKFLGQHGEFDLYACKGGSIIARYGNDGPEYASMDATIIRHNLASLEPHRTGVSSTDALLEALARYDEAWGGS